MIYGLLLGLLAVATYQNHTDVEKAVAGEASSKALHDVALRQFNEFFEDRRLRIYSVTAGIPVIMWYTVAVGALLNMVLIWLFDLRLGTHLLLGGLISFFTGTMISLIVLMDNPFRGEVGVSPQAFELIYQQMMTE